jgi:hypothetical protein
VTIGQALGFGIGLRACYYDDLLADTSGVDWVEALTENYLIDGGPPLDYLDRIRDRYPVALHGVSLSIGSVDPPNKAYLDKLKTLAHRVQPAWISDHLCWTGVDGINTHDLLPLPFTDEALTHVAQKIESVQESLGQRLVIENVSSYVQFPDSRMPEWEFLGELSRKTGCRLLLDINNVHVNSINHGFDAYQYLNSLPVHAIQQFHIAGHTVNDDVLIDTHDQAVSPSVWDLYVHAVGRFGPVSTLLERDDHLPPFRELLSELDEARRLQVIALAGQTR